MAGSPGMASPSWMREVMPSLAKTFPRWYWTVRALMNSRAPISGFGSPSQASRAIWSLLGRQLVMLADAERLWAVSPVARSSRRARSVKAATPTASRMSWAVRSCSRASPLRRSRRSHSP